MANHVIDFSLPNNLLEVFYTENAASGSEMVGIWQIPVQNTLTEFGANAAIPGILTASSYNSKVAQSDDTAWTYANVDREMIENNAEISLFDWANVSLDSASQRDSESIESTSITFYERNTQKDSINLAADLPSVLQLSVDAESFEQAESIRYSWLDTENASVDSLLIDATVLEMATLNVDAVLDQQEGLFLPTSVSVEGVGTLEIIGDEAIIDRQTSLLLNQDPVSDAMDLLGMDMMSMMSMMSMMPGSEVNQNDQDNIPLYYSTEGELIIDTLAFSADLLADSVYEVKLAGFDIADTAAPVVGQVLGTVDLF